MPAKTAKRAYDSSRRTRQAAQTRADVLHAAIELFRERGWSGTTLAAVAERAGVSVETIYKGFTSKKALLREAADVAVVGDAEPIPFVERPEFLALDQGTVPERLAYGAWLVAEMQQRTAGVWLAIIEAAGSDDEVAGWRLELDQRRRVDVGRGMARALGHPLDEETVTMLWLLYSADAYLRLTRDLGMSRAQYEAMLVDGTTRILRDHL